MKLFGRHGVYVDLGEQIKFYFNDYVFTLKGDVEDFRKRIEKAIEHFGVGIYISLPELEVSKHKQGDFLDVSLFISDILQTLENFDGKEIKGFYSSTTW